MDFKLRHYPVSGCLWWVTMIESIKKIIQKYLLLSRITAILVPVTILTAIFLFIYSNREIVYKTDINSKCGLSGSRGKDCAGVYHIIIGNTGAREEKVRLLWPRDLSAWGNADFRIMNITADRPRAHDPVCKCAITGIERVCAINNFAPGTLVIMEFECYACSKEEISRLVDTPVTVQTEANTLHGDPRITTLFWRMQNLLNVFM